MSELQKTINNLKQVLEAGDVVLRKLLEEEEAEPEHVWEHGDVFENKCGVKMVYLTLLDGDLVFRLSSICQGHRPIDFLPGATFLFNIKEKLCQHQQ